MNASVYYALFHGTRLIHRRQELHKALGMLRSLCINLSKLFRVLAHLVGYVTGSYRARIFHSGKLRSSFQEKEEIVEWDSL